MNCNYNSPYEPDLNSSNSSQGGGSGGRIELEFTYLTFGEMNTAIVGFLPANKSVFKIQMIVYEAFDNLEIAVREQTNNTSFAHFEKSEMAYINNYYALTDNSFATDSNIIIQKVNSTESSGRAKIILYYL